MTAAASADLPDQVTLTCTRAGSFVSSPTVRPHSDGVRLTIDNRGDFTGYQVRSAGAGSAHGGDLDPGENQGLMPDPPGEYWIQCYDDVSATSLRPDRTPHEVTVEVLDPEGLYQQYDLECDGARPEFGGRFEGFDESDDVERWIRANIPGVGSSDAILYPGYPDVDWKGDFRVIERDGRRVALVQMWGIDVRRCPGIDIGN